MIVNFSKMHGLGNDFVVIDTITQGPRFNKNHFARIADRRLGIGCDQIILVAPPTKADTDFFYKIYNADGKEAEQCVNGLRCAAKFFVDMGLTDKTELLAQCAGGISQVTVSDTQVTARLQTYGQIETKALNIPGLPAEIHTISLGNPHGVIVVDEIDIHAIKINGRKLSKASIFPNGANIGFMQVIDKNTIKLRVFERGSGLTSACGSGACAAAIVGQHMGLLDKDVTVKFKYGDLNITLDPEHQALIMTGPAVTVYIGRFRI